jgi:hypothetical protein
MSPNDGNDNQRIGNKERTSPCQTSVLNLGNTPQLMVSENTDNNNFNNEDVTDRDPWKFLSSQAQAMAFLKMAAIPERRDNFVHQFEAAMKEGRKTTLLYAGHLLDGWRMHIDTLCL